MLKVRETKHPQTTILELTGAFDHQATTGIESLIVGAQELGCKHIILDFAKVTGLDSIVLGRLFMWYHKMHPHHVKISIVNPQPRIQKILQDTHISELIPIESLDGEVVNHNGHSHNG